MYKMMIKLTAAAALFWAIVSLGPTVVEAGPRADDPTGILLIDRSGSMDTIRDSTGNSRCQDALTQAEAAVHEFFARPAAGGASGAELAVWTFSGTTTTEISGYGDLNTALAAVNSLDPTGCDGATPLADAMCAAADHLLESSVGRRSRLLHVATDGGENSSTGECAGDPGSPFERGTWQNNVLKKMVRVGCVVNADYWLDPDLLYKTMEQTGVASSDLGADIRQEVPFPQVFRAPAPPTTPDSSGPPLCATETECEMQLFYSLTVVTRGDYRVVADSESAYPCALTEGGLDDLPECPAPDGGSIYW